MSGSNGTWLMNKKIALEPYNLWVLQTGMILKILELGEEQVKVEKYNVTYKEINNTICDLKYNEKLKIPTLHGASDGVNYEYIIKIIKK